MLTEYGPISIGPSAPHGRQEVVWVGYCFLCWGGRGAEEKVERHRRERNTGNVLVWGRA